MKSNGFKLGSVILIILITSVLSAVTTGVIINNNYLNRSGLSYSDIMSDQYISEFLSIYAEIKEKFYGDYDELGMLSAAASGLMSYTGNSESEAIASALEAMLDYLGDDYTTFLNNSQYDYLSEELSGKYEGIGITITENIIIGVTKNSPAANAGLMVNDVIVSVNNQDITSGNSFFISYLITNSEDEEIKINVMRDEELITFSLYKDFLDASTKSFMTDDNNIGYISLSVFSENCSMYFEDALIELEAAGMESLIIDLRNNGGGYLNEALEIASLFLEEGSVINSLVSNTGKQYNYDETKESRDYDIIILINNDSASAAEILAAALNDNDIAKLVGMQSFGKGTVQQLIESSTGTTAKYTTAYWYTPKEVCINNIGITPDYTVETEYTLDEDGNINWIIDSQYNKAIELLKGA